MYTGFKESNMQTNPNIPVYCIYIYI